MAALDTYAFVKRLTAAGMPEVLAEVLADEKLRLIDDRLATKENIARSEVAFKGELEAGLSETKVELLKRMFGRTLLIIGVFMASLRFGHWRTRAIAAPRREPLSPAQERESRLSPPRDPSQRRRRLPERA